MTQEPIADAYRVKFGATFRALLVSEIPSIEGVGPIDSAATEILRALYDERRGRLEMMLAAADAIAPEAIRENTVRCVLLADLAATMNAVATWSAGRRTALEHSGDELLEDFG
jgi:hypothetical protein